MAADPTQTTSAAVDAAPIRGGGGVRSRGLLAQTLYRIWRQRMGKFSIAVLTIMVLMAIFAPIVAPHDPAQQYRGDFLAPPSWNYLFGTDQIGRDLLSRVIFAARASLIAGVLSILLSSAIGIPSGLVAGYLGRWPDAVIMRIYDGLLAFPNILLAIVVVTILGPGMEKVAIGIGVGFAPAIARLTRSIVLSTKERDYILAARAVGASGTRIVAAHLLPNTLPMLTVQLAMAMGFAVLAEGGLSFLGLGVQPPTPSWGRMLADSRAYMRDAPLYGIAPGVALSILVISLNFLADALREALDPRRINISS